MVSKAVYLVDGARTPFLKARGLPGPFSASDLATQCARALLLRQPFEPSALNEVILGCAAPSVDETNIGRVVALRAGCGEKISAWTVMRNCASGLQAIDSGMQSIQTGRAHLVLAGGTDALSHTPLLYSPKMVRWFAEMAQKKTALARAQHFLSLSIPELFKPVIGLMRGLTDPVVGLSMGQTAENLAWKFGITKDEMDAFAAQSHQRVLHARTQNAFDEIIPITDADGLVYTQDDGVREDCTPSALAKLRPVFDKPYGNITAGNSSQVTDGAALCLLASEEAVRTHGLKPLAKIIDLQWAGLDPAFMGLGPVHAATPILQRQGLGLSDIDLWEINEAFAAQVIACLRAWDDTAFCEQALGTKRMGAIDADRINVDGGAIAIGHPVGASGARITLHLANAMRRRGDQKGVAAICIGGGQGGAVLLESCAS